MALLSRNYELNWKSSAKAVVRGHGSNAYCARKFYISGHSGRTFCVLNSWIIRSIFRGRKHIVFARQNQPRKIGWGEDFSGVPLLWQHLCSKTVAKKCMFFRAKNCHAKLQQRTRFFEFFWSRGVANFLASVDCAGAPMLASGTPWSMLRREKNWEAGKVLCTVHEFD